MGIVMVKKFLALMLAFMVALNFSAMTFAKTPEEKAAATFRRNLF